MPRRLLDSVVRRLDLPDDPAARAATLVDSEWLVTNGLGGYASATGAGSNTRRYHGVLIAALPHPLGRMGVLNPLGGTGGSLPAPPVDFAAPAWNARAIGAVPVAA